VSEQPTVDRDGTVREPLPADNECATCHQPVRWGTTVSGKTMPIDPLPVDPGVGNVVEVRVGTQWRFKVLGGGDLREDNVPVYLSHFVTCPDADTHRNRARRRVADPDAVTTRPDRRGHRVPTKRCSVCWGALDPVLANQDEDPRAATTHPCCE
jgi:hypothetical protein